MRDSVHQHVSLEFKLLCRHNFLLFVIYRSGSAHNGKRSKIIITQWYIIKNAELSDWKMILTWKIPKISIVMSCMHSFVAFVIACSVRHCFNEHFHHKTSFVFVVCDFFVCEIKWRQKKKANSHNYRKMKAIFKPLLLRHG